MKDGSEGEASSFYWSFHSSENGTSSYRPKLEVNCSAAGLPVNLLEFKGKRNNHQIIIDWKAGYEKNNDGFVLERSLDGVSWIKIGFQKGIVNSIWSKNRQTQYSLAFC